jgi:hypothetical protein
MLLVTSLCAARRLCLWPATKETRPKAEEEGWTLDPAKKEDDTAFSVLVVAAAAEFTTAILPTVAAILRKSWTQAKSTIDKPCQNATPICIP